MTGLRGNHNGSGAATPDQLFRRNAGFRERHDRPRCRPLRQTVRFGIRHLWARTNRHRQRDRHALIADHVLDFTLDVMCELTRTELRKIDAVASS